MGTLAGKVAIVTGASKGIGAAIAKSFAAEGAAVVVNYASSRQAAEAVVAEIERAGGRAVAVQADMAKQDDIRRLFRHTREVYGELDILVNNAGVYAFQPLEAVSEQEYRRQFDINVLGPILAAREALAYFRPEGGRIINVSSVASTSPPPGSVIYSATKGALDVVTRVLAQELGPRNIRVNTIAPGPVETEGVQHIGLLTSDLGKQLVAQTPLARIGQPDDIAKVALFAASPASDWLTGERLVAAGGLR